MQEIFKVPSELICIWKRTNTCCDIIGRASLQTPPCLYCLLLLCRQRNSPIFDGSWSSLCLYGSPVWQWLLGSAQTERGCPGNSQQAAQCETSLPLFAPLRVSEQESSHAMGDTKNTVQMVATQQLAMYRGPVWFTSADIANLFHFIISRDISPVIRILLFPRCPFAAFLLRSKRSMPITFFFSCWKPLQSQILQHKKCDQEQKKCLEWH